MERVATKCVCCFSNSLEVSSAIMMPFISHRVFSWVPAKIDESWGLKSIPHGMAYALCNSLLCKDCNLLFQDIRFSESELEKLYFNYRGDEYTALREHYEPGYSDRNSELARTVKYLNESEKFIKGFIEKPRSILDWGGDTGLNTPFRSTDAEIYIYDISKKNIDSLELENFDRSSGHSLFDLVVCTNVLEHVSYPVDLIIKMSKYMKKDSALFIEVPHEKIVRESSPRMALAQKRHWHEHINFFSFESLEYLASNSGMSILGLRSFKTNETGNQDFVFQVVMKKK